VIVPANIPLLAIDGVLILNSFLQGDWKPNGDSSELDGES
jgi:hypothetical protein